MADLDIDGACGRLDLAP